MKAYPVSSRHKTNTGRLWRPTLWHKTNTGRLWRPTPCHPDTRQIQEDDEGLPSVAQTQDKHRKMTKAYPVSSTHKTNTGRWQRPTPCHPHTRQTQEDDKGLPHVTQTRQTQEDDEGLTRVTQTQGLCRKTTKKAYLMAPRNRQMQEDNQCLPHGTRHKCKKALKTYPVAPRHRQIHEDEKGLPCVSQLCGMMERGSSQSVPLVQLGTVQQQELAGCQGSLKCNTGNLRSGNLKLSFTCLIRSTL